MALYLLCNDIKTSIHIQFVLEERQTNKLAGEWGYAKMAQANIDK